MGVVARVTTPADTAPRAEFSCGSKGCQLVRVFDRANGWEVVRPRVHPVEKERLLAVNLASDSRK